MYSSCFYKQIIASILRQDLPWYVNQPMAKLTKHLINKEKCRYKRQRTVEAYVELYFHAIVPTNDAIKKAADVWEGEKYLYFKVMNVILILRQTLVTPPFA